MVIILLCLLSDFACSQKKGDKSPEKIEKEMVSQPSGTHLQSFFKSRTGMIIESIFGTIVIYFLIQVLFKKFIMRLFLKNNWQRYLPVMKISYWILAICFISIFILKPATETIIIIGIIFFAILIFAFQDLLKNIFAGILILFDKQIQVGDTIQIGSYLGEIYQIGLKNIKLITPEKQQVSIPNSEFVKQTKFISDSKESYTQVTTEIYLPPKIDMVKVKMIARLAALTSRYIYLNRPIETIIKNEIHQNQSIIKLVIIAYIFNKKYESKFSSELTEIVMEELGNQKLISSWELALS
jgi:small-conductance mechanosensitive channel